MLAALLSTIFAPFSVFAVLDYKGIGNTFDRVFDFNQHSYVAPVQPTQPVPEPCAVAILVMGGIALISRKRTRITRG